MSRHGITETTPPIILTLENSGMCGSIAITAPGLCLAEYSLTSKVTHSKRLLGSLEFLMREAGIDWQDIDAIAVSLGPGSFTGLRIGLTTAKGLVMATGKKLIGISSLDGLAAQLQDSDKLICPAIDARKKQVYTALYRNMAPKTQRGVNDHGENDKGQSRRAAGKQLERERINDNEPLDCPPRFRGAAACNLQRISPQMAVSPRDLAAMIKEPVIFIGDGGVLYQEIFIEELGDMANLALPEVYFPRAAAIGRLALHKWQAKEFLDPISAAPVYVRPSDAEMTLKR